MESNTHNDIFTLAADIVRNTSQSVFLTGKAGTGKTTFLHHIRNNVDKNVIVAAPTGVAAINAGGVTLHSLFQLPFEPFIPNFEGKKKLDYHSKLRKSKIDMFRELDLLIIDEVSMLRADMLDAIDNVLRRWRNSSQPFGGVQLLLIGDMFQLPPVVQQQEWEEMKNYYPSPFFFHAQAMEDNLPLYIELKTIYRQSDQKFIDILNHIRNNRATAGDLQILNQRYNPSFELPEENRYIVLCTHNYKADRINSEKLAQLKSEEISFEGRIHGDFAENSFPTDLRLTLKVGAQIMFIRNDAGENRRYYNGKLATISYLSHEKIFVRFEDGLEMELEEETWRNVRYTLNDDSGDIEEEELGAFIQYPIRLAWAITIHKSQGLTFDRVVIDAGQAFAGGQVYVALSRCTSLEGIVLYSRITPASIHTDESAIAFSRQERDLSYLKSVLANEKPRYCAEQLKKNFDWMPMVRCVRSFYELVSEKKIPKQDEVMGMVSQMYNKAIEQQEIAQNFQKELDRILYNPNINTEYLKTRVEKAVFYFHRAVQENILLPTENHSESLKNASKVKQYLKSLREIHQSMLSLLGKLENVHYGNTPLTADLTFERMKAEPQEAEAESEKKPKAQKGDSQRLTLTLFSEGKTIAEISAERNLTTTTVESHLVTFIRTGEVDVYSLIPDEKVKFLTAQLQRSTEKRTLTEIKESLPREYTYLDIRAVIAHLAFEKSEK